MTTPKTLHALNYLYGDGQLPDHSHDLLQEAFRSLLATQNRNHVIRLTADELRAIRRALIAHLKMLAATKPAEPTVPTANGPTNEDSLILEHLLAVVLPSSGIW